MLGVLVLVPWMAHIVLYAIGIQKGHLHPQGLHKSQASMKTSPFELGSDTLPSPNTVNLWMQQNLQPSKGSNKHIIFGVALRYFFTKVRKFFLIMFGILTVLYTILDGQLQKCNKIHPSLAIQRNEIRLALSNGCFHLMGGGR